METSEFQVVLDAIRQNVAVAVEKTGIGLKPLAKQAGMGETAIRDLLKKHHKDVQIGTLAKIAEATGTPLINLIQIEPVKPAISRRSLERALAEAMPELPEAEERRVQYLLSTVERVLRLPVGLRDEPGNDDSPEAEDGDEGVPVPRPTK